MSFNSIEYLLFVPIVTFLFFTLPHKFRIGLLLVASIVFYMSWNAWYILLILFSALVDYWCGIKIAESTQKKTKRFYLGLSLTANLGLLGYFKYCNFFIQNINDIAGADVIPHLNIILPVGISFYTFQTLSYSIDIYFDKLKPEKNIANFALYVTFFPQLVAGPIERASNLIHQLKEKKAFSYPKLRSGLQLIAFGVFKKVVIADHCGVLVDYGFSHSDQIYGLSWLILVVFYAFQIYCDFSGYSDIARGTAEMLGFNLMINFKQPFLSQSIIELWNNWHISLTTWFRDYIFTPLSKGVRKKRILLFNLFVIYFISGVWHGANWNFILWGIFHGLLIVFFQLTKKGRKKIRSTPLLQRFSTTLYVFEVVGTFFLFFITGLFFRNTTLGQTLSYYKSMFLESGRFIHDVISNEHNIRGTIFYLGTDVFYVAITLLSIIFLMFMETRQKKYVSGRVLLDRQPIALRWSFYLFLIFAVIISSATIKQPFIYFQF